MTKLRALRATTEPKWFEYVEEVELLIASSGCPEFKQAARAAFKPHRRRLRAGQITDKEKEDIVKSAAAEHLLRGWRGLEDDSDESLEYSPAVALELFVDPELYDLYDFVLEKAGDWQEYLKELQEEAGKN